MIHVIATIRALEHNRETLMEDFLAIVPVVRAKDGCLAYSLAVGLQSGFPGQIPFDANEFVIVEKWTDLDALKAHIVDETYQAWLTDRWRFVAGASMQVFEETG